MENKVEAVNDGQEQGLCNTATQINPSEETKTDVGTQPKLIKDVPELKEKINCSNGIDASANNGEPITSPLGNLDVLDNGILADKSPCTIGNHEAVNGKPKSIGNGDAASMHVDEKDLFAPDTMQPESASKESVDLSLDPEKTGHDNEPHCDSSPRANNLIIKSSEDVAPVISSEHNEQTMTALLKEAVQDEMVLSGNLVSPDKASAHNAGELSKSPDTSKTQLFKAAIEEFSRGGGIPASLPDLQSDETAMSKSKLKGEAFQKLLQTFDDQLEKAFGEEKATLLKQSGEASMKDKNETSVENGNLIPEGPGSVVPEKNNLTSEC